jgi:hypothetical protein
MGWWFRDFYPASAYKIGNIERVGGLEVNSRLSFL